MLPIKEATLPERSRPPGPGPGAEAVGGWSREAMGVVTLLGAQAEGYEKIGRGLIERTLYRLAEPKEQVSAVSVGRSPRAPILLAPPFGADQE